MSKPKTTARLIVTYKCNRCCPGCCNGHDNSVRKIAYAKELLKYDEIVITGGEPMLIKKDVIRFLLLLRSRGFSGNIYMYTAFFEDDTYSDILLERLDGITFTIHAEASEDDIEAFKRLSDLVATKSHLNRRLFIDGRTWGKFEILQRKFPMWDEVRKLEWKDECQPAEHEELLYFPLDGR